MSKEVQHFWYIKKNYKDIASIYQITTTTIIKNLSFPSYILALSL